MVVIKIISVAPIKPGIESGKIILKNCWKELSPKSFDASKRVLSIFSNDTNIGSIANGAQPWVKAIITALLL